MTEADAGDEIGAEQGEGLEALQRRASDLERNADAATQTYERTTWIKYAAIFIPIPLWCCS